MFAFSEHRKEECSRRLRDSLVTPTNDRNSGMIRVVNYLYHIAQSKDWEDAKISGNYMVSTLGKTLSEVGFIHLSFANQVNRVADFLYRGVDDLILLEINPEKLDSVVKIEPVTGTDEKFPHLYGPINLDAVEEVVKYQLASNGSFPVVGYT